uniref:ZZ-type domain-containing protein n=1 Tax=Anolis carolinensis TaxID=28377 RepID=A0A803T204_ANOCA
SLFYFTEALNVIPNSVYRTALKLRAVQSLCQLDLTDVSLVEYILPSHSCQAEKQKPLPAEQLFKGLTELFKRASSEKPGQVEPRAPELTLRLLMAAYDRNGVGFIQPRSSAAAMIALSGDSLPTKYRGKGYIIFSYMNKLCTVSCGDCEQTGIPFQVLNSAVGEERFLAWLWSEPAVLLWLPTLYRLLATEMVTHKVKCNVCKHFPITGLRYHCLKCLNFNLCQTCFFTGQLCKPHKKTHPIVEHCRTQVSARDNIKLFSRVIRNNLLPGRCKRKEALRRKALGLMDNRDFPTQGIDLLADMCIENGARDVTTLVLSLVAATSQRMPGGAILAKQYNFSSGVGHRHPVIMWHVSLRATSTVLTW